MEYISDQPWLFTANGFLGCKVCRDVKQLGALQKHGVHLSKQWFDSMITYNANTCQNQLSSWRKKIHEHEKGGSHITADEIVHKALTATMESLLQNNKSICMIAPECLLMYEKQPTAL